MTNIAKFLCMSFCLCAAACSNSSQGPVIAPVFQMQTNEKYFSFVVNHIGRMKFLYIMSHCSMKSAKSSG